MNIGYAEIDYHFAHTWSSKITSVMFNGKMKDGEDKMQVFDPGGLTVDFNMHGVDY